MTPKKEKETRKNIISQKVMISKNPASTSQLLQSIASTKTKSKFFEFISLLIYTFGRCSYYKSSKYKTSLKSSTYKEHSNKTNKSKDEEHYKFEVGDIIEKRYKVNILIT